MATGLTPDFGAIFMSSKLTKKECLRKKLFGLPSSFNNFVKHVKAGMLLFLFEYESRQLDGVFEATSDGAIDIMPGAYRSSGKNFPAQVKVKVVWNCRPLMEYEFFDAIKDNYFQATKFNFGLSKDQVYRLLLLFHQKRVWTEEPQIFSTQHVNQEEKPDDLYLEDHVPAGCTCTRTGHPSSKMSTHCNQDTLFTGKEDPIIDNQLISSLGVPVTKKTEAISHYQPYDPEKSCFHCFPPCAETGIKPSMSEPGSGFPIPFEGQSEEIHMVAENVDSFIDSVRKDLELGNYSSLDSPSYTVHCNPATKISNPDCSQAASLSYRHYRYPEPYINNRFYSRHVREIGDSSSWSDEDEKFIHEATARGAKPGTRSKKLSAFEQPDDLYSGDHTQIGCRKGLELGDFIPLDSSPCVKPYHPTKRISNPDCRQTTTSSSRHFGYPEQSHSGGFFPHHAREKEVSSCQNDIHEGFLCEANDKGAKSGPRSQKRVSVFSRISFAPKDSRESDYKNGSPNDSTLAIMEQLQKKHDNWGNGFNRVNFKGHEDLTNQRRRVSAFSKLRLTPGPIQGNANCIMEGCATSLGRNSQQKAKRKLSDRKDLQVAKSMNINHSEISESNATQTEKVETRQNIPECSSTQKQSQRRKLIRPVFGLGPLGRECVNPPNPDPQLPHNDQSSKGESGSLVGAAESVCLGDHESAKESVSLVDKGQVSFTSCEEVSDEMTAKKSVHEVPVEAGSGGSLLSREPETEVAP